MPLERLFTELNTSSVGLTSEEAKARLKKFGFNMLVEKKQASILYKFAVHFKDLFGILLLVGSVLAAIGGMPELSLGIFGVVLINVFFSMFQESRAEKAMQTLKHWMPEYAKVMRNGELTKILVKEIVPGDIIFLDEGDRVPADARVSEVCALVTNPAPLIGEAGPSPRFSTPSEELHKTYLES